MDKLNIKLTPEEIRLIDKELTDKMNSLDYTITYYTMYPTKEAAHAAGKSWHGELADNIDITKNRYDFLKQTRDSIINQLNQ